MKPTYLLVGLTATLPGGLCSEPFHFKDGNLAIIANRNFASLESPLSDGGIFNDARSTTRAPLPSAPISPANIALRYETSSLSPPLAWSGSRDLVVRVDQFQTKTQLAVKILSKSSLIGIGGIAFWGLVDECRDLRNDPNAGSGIRCVVGSIGTSISIVSYYKTITKFFIEYTKDWKMNVISGGANFAYNAYAGGRLGFGPFARTQVGVTPGPLKRDASSIFMRAEGHLSSVLGVEVRTIGIWDGTMPGEWHPIARRDEPEELIPVFGLNFAGQDVHLAYLGQDAENNGVFKIGQGPGPATPDNKLRLRARDSTPLYNNYYFDQGGLDIVGDSDIDGNYNKADIFPDASSNDYDWAWVYDQVECYMGTSHDEHTSQMDAIGMWFQIYDAESYGTLSAGVIAPFSGTTQSVIQWLRPDGRLETSATCTNYHNPTRL